MAIIRGDKFKFSSTFYAINWDDFVSNLDSPTLPDVVSMSVSAVWFKRQNGKTVVCMGSLDTSTNRNRAGIFEGITEAALREIFEQVFDGRYGGRTTARWDGESLWAPQMDFQQMIAVQNFLEPLLQKFETEDSKIPPADHEGWYSINDKR